MFDRNLVKLDGMKAVMGALTVLALLQAAAIIGQALILGIIIGNLWSGSALPDEATAIVAFFVCFALLQLLRFGQETMLDRYSEHQAMRIRDSVLNATFDSSIMLASHHGAAVTATTATEGIDEIQTYIRIIPPKIIDMAALSIPILIAVYVFDWVGGIILTVMFPVIIFFMILLGRQASAQAERQYASYTRLSNRFMDTLRGLDVIRAFGAGDSEAQSVHGFSERLRHATIGTLTTATLSSAILDLCTTLGVAAVAMMLAFRLMDGTMQLSHALTVLVLAPEYFLPIRSFASDFHASLDGKNALAAALGMIAPDNECISESANPQIFQSKSSNESNETVLDEKSFESNASDFDEASINPDNPPSDSSVRAWKSDSLLELNDVILQYESGACAGPFSLRAHGFERIGIVGASGAGKSSLAQILSGFTRPSRGSILIDSAPADLTEQSWKQQLRFIPQHPYMFHASLLDNIRFYAPEASLDDVNDVIAAVGLCDLVDELPDGLATIIGQGGRGLSGGQSHRIALARVLLDKSARVLVFDEPTAHLDIETELELKPYMLDAMKGKLVFFATHRLHWTHDMDLVVRLGKTDVVSYSTEEVAHG